MLCDHCQSRDAVVHLTRIVEQEVTQVHLCEQCAAAKGIESGMSAPMHPLAGILQAAQQQQAAMSDAARCAYCGTSQKDFRASGRLGCAHCYGAFAESLRELLRRVHGNAKHVGRRYEPPNPAGAPLRSVESLRDLLQEAVAREDFERAAALRDEIRGRE
jgi:protein arginine kinase activator